MWAPPPKFGPALHMARILRGFSRSYVARESRVPVSRLKYIAAPVLSAVDGHGGWAPAGGAGCSPVRGARGVQVPGGDGPRVPQGCEAEAGGVPQGRHHRP